jgi:hypothetical protein
VEYVNEDTPTRLRSSRADVLGRGRIEFRHEVATAEQEDGELIDVEVDEGAVLVGDVAPKVPADEAVPGRLKTNVELGLEVAGHVAFELKLAEGVDGEFHRHRLHPWAHVVLLNDHLWRQRWARRWDGLGCDDLRGGGVRTRRLLTLLLLLLLLRMRKHDARRTGLHRMYHSKLEARGCAEASCLYVCVCVFVRARVRVGAWVSVPFCVIRRFSLLLW